MEKNTGGTSASVAIKEEPVSYTASGVTMNGYITYDTSKQGPRPIVLILPEWWGLTEYPRMRARMLAEMGYLAMAVDMYGNGKLANNPEEAGKAAGPFYENLPMAKARIDAALAKAKSYAQADTSKTVAIGYCFGGFLALNYAKMGAPVKGVVSFHGDLRGVPPQKGTQAQFLVCHGGADNFVPQPQVDAFRKSMDSAGLNYSFKVYENATHAFTNPNATEKGKEFNMPIRYNGAADTASWNDMKAFFGRIL
jgi:dienelactone hydrolase